MFKKTIIFITLIGLSINLCGCVLLLAGAAGGAGTAYWFSGKLTQDYNVPYSRAIQATHDALNALKLPLTKETTTSEATQIISKYSDGATVWIDIKLTTQAASSIAVRVGAKGNKEAERKIMEKISRYL
jgi:hypothetical protein